tara:strand:+ start:374 stop:802 length:429 start_codon:yes stop_codon:yes gene_type:complete
MGTRARIGIQFDDKSVLSVYHHWDGYPSWLGRILQTHYNTKKKVSSLVDGGDMSCCWTKQRWSKVGEPGGVTSEDDNYGPQYYSQRGEECPPRYDETVKEFLDSGEEYAYIFTKRGWVCYNTRSWDDNYLNIEQIPTGHLVC